MCAGPISVCLDGTTQSHDGFLVSTQQEFGQSRDPQPAIHIRVARREAQRLIDMSFGFLAATDN
jgi:hypothetical protein